MRAVVTGATGFIGCHLVAHLSAAGHEVHGVARGALRERQEEVGSRLLWQPLGVVSQTACDVRDGQALDDALARIKPELIFHLAGFASARQAMELALECWDVNVRGTVNLLQAASRRCPGATILLAGTAMQYGIVGNSGLPIRETEPMRPVEPYGASKAAAELAGQQWAASYGLRVVLLRAFNATGPGQDPEFVCSDFARQIARIERGLQRPVIATGDLSMARDLTDVRDVVVAFRMATERCQPGQPYNVCTGEAISIGQVLDILRSLSGARFSVETDPARVRRIDIPVLRGDPTQFRESTGWRPGIPLRETLHDLLRAWRESVAGDEVRRS